MAAWRQVIVHAGFHKTGTTSVQRGLRLNRPALRDHVQVFLRPAMVAVCEAARAFSQHRSPLERALFQYEVAQFAEGWAADDPRPILLSSEDLSGHMPGRRGLTHYDTAPQLMQMLAETLQQVWPNIEVTFYFSTRSAQPWLTSCYAQHLTATRMVLSCDDYVKTYQSSANLDAVVDDIAAAVAPHTVQRCALEDSQTRRLGPLAPVLDFIALPKDVRAAITPPPVSNIAKAPSKRDELLALNRSNLDTAALRIAKKAVSRGGT